MNIYVGKENNWYGETKVITATKVTDGLLFSNGLSLFDEHEQECCESVYADWSSLEDTGFYQQKFKEIKLDFVKDVGFKINGYTVHCYNSQNGYYSSELQLLVMKGSEVVTTIDISDYVEDDID